MNFTLNSKQKKNYKILSMLNPFLNHKKKILIHEATIAQEVKNWKLALRLWLGVVEIENQDSNAHLQIGNMYNELEEYEKAVESFNNALKVDANCSEAISGIAGVYERCSDWEAAKKYWQKYILFIETKKLKNGYNEAHAYEHLILSSLFCMDFISAESYIKKLEGIASNDANIYEAIDQKIYLSKIRICKIKNNVEDFKKLTIKHLKYKKDIEIMYEFSAACLSFGYYDIGISSIIDFYEINPAISKINLLLIDHMERMNCFSKVVDISINSIERVSGSKIFFERGKDICLKTKNHTKLRVLAILYYKKYNRLDYIHDLASLYETLGKLRKARLLCRLLKKKWPHSKYHHYKYIELVASTFSMPLADKFFRSLIKNDSGVDLDRLYYQIAWNSGNYSEAKRRLKFYLQRYQNDESAKIFLGYVIANTDGIDTAKNYFLNLATETYQNIGAVMGVAHMNMRSANLIATHQVFESITIMHPEDTVARVELARSAYRLRYFDEAVSTVSHQLKNNPNDVTMLEFCSWLLLALGKWTEARTNAINSIIKFGPSWEHLETVIHCSHVLNILDTTIHSSEIKYPEINTLEDWKKFYNIVRIIVSNGYYDYLFQVMNNININENFSPWFYQYIKDERSFIGSDILIDSKKAWENNKKLICENYSKIINNFDDGMIKKVVMREKYDQPKLHIINTFEQARGGSELHAIDLYDLLSTFANVDLWSPEMPHPEFTKNHNVKAIEPGQGSYPMGGVLIFVGIYFDISKWIGYTRPERVIFLYNTFEAQQLHEKLNLCFNKTGIKPEILYASNLMRNEIGYPGLFEPSPTDINAFLPLYSNNKNITIGRHSRDVIEKHHPEDWKIYRNVIQNGGKAHLLGGTCMRTVFPIVDGIDFLDARSDGIVNFLQSLDIYFYRTSTWVEPWGRVVVEAMACGLPVVVSDNGGYAQIIEHGVNGMLFKTTEEAVELVELLSSDEKLRHDLGLAARATVENLLNESSKQRIASFYLLDSKFINRMAQNFT